MTWASLRKFFLEAVGGATAAADPDIWFYLQQGLQRVVSSVEIPQIYATGDFTVLSGADSLDLSATSIYHVSTVYNKTDGIPCHEEPDGMGGRNRLLQITTGKPAPGSITHWWRDDTRLLVRSVPLVDTTLQIRYMRQLPALSDSDLNSSPITPQQYDLAIIQAAASVYFSLHPAENAAATDSEGHQITRQQLADAQFSTAIAVPKPVYAQENVHRRERMRLAGYSMTPRSRLGG